MSTRRQAADAKADAQTHEPRSPTPFRERVLALAGHSTWREGGGSRSTAGKPIPADHMIAGALSFGRSAPGDIGPDIAFDMAVGRTGHAERVCRWLGPMLAADRARATERTRQWHGWIAVIAYRAVVLGEPVPPAPSGARTEDWAEVVIFAGLLLETAAEDALALAARRSRQP